MHYLRKASVAALVAALGTAASAPALAGTDSVSMTVQATVPGTCRIQNPTVLNFGTLDVLGGDTENTATFEWRCTKGTPATISIDDGSSPSASGRAMVGATDSEELAYELYQDAPSSGGVRWGTGAEAVTVTGNGMGAAAVGTLTVYGRVLGADAEAVAADTYSDTVTVSIDW